MAFRAGNCGELSGFTLLNRKDKLVKILTCCDDGNPCYEQIDPSTELELRNVTGVVAFLGLCENFSHPQQAVTNIFQGVFPAVLGALDNKVVTRFRLGVFDKDIAYTLEFLIKFAALKKLDLTYETVQDPDIYAISEPNRTYNLDWLKITIIPLDDTSIPLQEIHLKQIVMITTKWQSLEIDLTLQMWTVEKTMAVAIYRQIEKWMEVYDKVKLTCFSVNFVDSENFDSFQDYCSELKNTSRFEYCCEQCYIEEDL